MKSLHLLITGRVQGVGFRDWLIHDAKKRGLTGWVRNIGSSSVEAVISGPDDAVDLCVQRCWRGPALAEVTDISITETAPPSEPGFTRRSTVTSRR
jgi:acylphosphatase